MKLTKSLLLASAAGLAAVATASAADLPSKKAAPVEYVKVCPAFGPGFFYIPGSETCLKVGGNVYVEGMYAQPYTKAQDTLGYRTQMRITLDARTNTEYGLLRTVVDPRFNKRNGLEQSASQQREGNAFQSTNSDGTAKQVHINTTAFIQLGGLTVGRLSSFATPQFSSNDLVGPVGTDARDEVTTVAYTASLGNGITITGALEDSTDSNRDGVYAVGGTVTYGGNRIPDAVLALKVDQSWGSANVAAQSHAINYSSNQFGVEYGYGVTAGVKVNLPMIAAGDSLMLNGTYASGFNEFVWRNNTGDKTANNNNGFQYNGGWYNNGSINDVVVNVANGQTYQAKSMGGVAEFTHYFTPTVAAFVGGSYAKLDWDSGAKSLGVAAINPTSIYTVYLGAIWTPVKGFKIVPEVNYAKANAKNMFPASGAEPAAKNIDSWQGRIQVRRDF